VSEYQYYKFERLDGYLDAKARQALRAISSRAEISATPFQVYYTYSDLKAEPSELILKYFDIGFYYANWGSIDAYIKLPAGTLPDALLGFSSDGLYVHQSDEWQLLIFCLEEYYEYFDDEHADDFFQHLASLRSELMQGNWRLVYFMWLKECDFNDQLDGIPLIQCPLAGMRYILYFRSFTILQLCCLAIGNSIQNREPCPSTLSKPIVPCISSTNFLVITSPTPVP